ncbi:carboxypeptidase regulatory-like domain-containing protein [Catellatospora coxensis]|uniref:carboxypeptidase-like regulatory domain-containing protein n=1 Tax=Catellatospora coxensis TaxID=310354 RepID=UPI0019428FCE|nr:carboxypeptidase-like regulatory domain-containing protein [Catellatospora coxensis]
MLKTSARRLGVLALALAIGTLGLAAPAQAADTGSIVGQLTDGGQPVNGASVQATAVDGDGWGYASTDAGGHYQLTDLPAGAYRVRFDVDGRPGQYAFGQVNYTSAALITVPAGGQATVDDALLPTGTITGTFRDRAGNGMAVSVRADSADGEGASGYADADGHYTLRVLPGSYRLSFEIASGVYQYAPGAIGYDGAVVYPVAVGQTVTVDDTKLPTGSIAGRFTDRDGTGIGDVQVQVSSQSGPSYSATTDGAGDYRIDDVFVSDDYTVAFHSWERQFSQHAYGKIDSADATEFAVTADAVTRVDDTLLPTGTVHFTVTDALTGAPIPAFYAEAGMVNTSGTDGQATLAGVTVGQQHVFVSADGYLGGHATVTVTDGATTEAVVALTPVATVTTTVVDARTGAPVAGFCVQPVVPTDLYLGEGCSRSDSEGKVSIDGLRAGAYQLFAYAPRYTQDTSPYGAQWVTADGGTGTQTLAAVITAVAGQTVAAPTVKLDRRGVLTGTIRAADGTPAKNAYVSFGNFHYHSGDGGITFPAAADGAYTVDFLGPYLWPLHFYAADHAPQWSGNSGGRSGATKVKVRAGKTVVYDIQLLKGTKVTVNSPQSGAFVAYHAATGETSGRCGAWPAMTCEMLVLGPQKVRFKIWGSEEDFWYGGADFATATSVSIPATGTLTVNVTR